MVLISGLGSCSWQGGLQRMRPAPSTRLYTRRPLGPGALAGMRPSSRNTLCCIRHGPQRTRATRCWHTVIHCSLRPRSYTQSDHTSLGIDTPARHPAQNYTARLDHMCHGAKKSHPLLSTNTVRGRFRTARAQRAHSARTAPIITVIIRVTTLKTTHLRNHAQSIQNSKIQTSDACHGSQGPKFCPL